jgi:DNA recombination protein Rad52
LDSIYVLKILSQVFGIDMYPESYVEDFVKQSYVPPGTSSPSPIRSPSIPRRVPVEWVRNHDGTILLDHRGHPLSVDRLLATKPLRQELSSRPGPGNRKLTYLSGEGVTRTLNEVFGYDGWNLEIKGTNREQCEKDEKNRYHVAYTSIVRLTHRKSGAYKEDCGAGDAIDRSMGTAISHALKASITDALKRCARHFGDKLGNSLYQGTFSIQKAPATLEQALEMYATERANSKFGAVTNPEHDYEDSENKSISPIRKITNFQMKTEQQGQDINYQESGHLENTSSISSSSMPPPPIKSYSTNNNLLKNQSHTSMKLTILPSFNSKISEAPPGQQIPNQSIKSSAPSLTTCTSSIETFQTPMQSHTLNVVSSMQPGLLRPGLPHIVTPTAIVPPPPTPGERLQGSKLFGQAQLHLDTPIGVGGGRVTDSNPSSSNQEQDLRPTTANGIPSSTCPNMGPFANRKRSSDSNFDESSKRSKVDNPYI